MEAGGQLSTSPGPGSLDFSLLVVLRSRLMPDDIGSNPGSATSEVCGCGQLCPSVLACEMGVMTGTSHFQLQEGCGPGYRYRA